MFLNQGEEQPERFMIKKTVKATKINVEPQAKAMAFLEMKMGKNEDLIASGFGVEYGIDIVVIAGDDDGETAIGV